MTVRRVDPTELEELFARNMLSRRQFVAGLAALGVTASGIEALAGSAPLPAEAAAAAAQYLVLIVLDAFRPDYMKLAAMPTLSALAKEGVSYDRAWVGHVETLTPTGHAALSTGALPKNNGILGFEWRNPLTGREALDGWAQGVLSGAMERDLRESGADSIPLAVKAADPTARVVSISSEKVYAAGAFGGWAADYILYHRRDSARQMLIPSAVPGHEPPADFFTLPGLQQRLPLQHFTDWDYLSTMLALASIKAFRPRVLMVNLPGTDVYGHPYGGPATPSVFKQIVAGVDRNIARIVQAYKDEGIFDQTLFLVTADHGMVPNVRSVDGALTKRVVQAAGGQYFFHTGGTAAYIYLHNTAAAPDVARAMAQVPNVVGAYYKRFSQAEYYYDRATVTRIDPALDGANRFLLRTFAGATAPDVVAVFRENTIGSKVSSAHGDHGGLNWGAQHVPLIMAGPGVLSNVTSHFPARLADVAPTALRLLGLASPDMDGIVLADALAVPVAQEVTVQSAQRAQLAPYQDGLIQQSSQNVAEDVRAHLLPPPSLPARP